MIYCIIDYKGNFGSKYDANPYRSGMNLRILEKELKSQNIKITFLKFSEVNLFPSNFWIDKNVIYTSSEDSELHYKSYIEDIVYYLEKSGAKVIPRFDFLKANNNKVFMEMVLKSMNGFEKLKSFALGSLTDLELIRSKISYPIVYKLSAGAMSRGVGKADNYDELRKKLKRLLKSSGPLDHIKELVRERKHEGYKREDRYRKKFILQEFLPGLKGDYKILIFGDKYFIFHRSVRKNDFRASGSGNENYLYGSKCNTPAGIFDFAQSFYNELGVPQLSLDLAYDGNDFYIIEFQALYFGTVGIVKSDVFYKKDNDTWREFDNNISLEKMYAESVFQFLLINKNENSIRK